MGKLTMGAMGFMLGAGMMLMPAGKTIRRKANAARRWMKENL